MGVNGIYGLSGSGLDIESMVKVGMMSKQREYDKMAQKYTKNEWQKTALLDVYNNVNTFNMTTLSQYKLSTNMNARTATSSNDAIKVTANASAAKMTHKVEVEQLAASAYLISTNKLFTEDEDGNKKSLSDYGSSISFSLYDGTDKDPVAITLDIDDKTTLTDLAAAINKAGLNIRATYDVDNDTFSIYNTKSGAANTIEFSNIDPDTADLFNDLGFYKSVDGKLIGTSSDSETASGSVYNEDTDDWEITTTTTTTTDYKPFSFDDDLTIEGQNAKVLIDGVTYEKADNKFTAGGITYDVSNATKGEIAKVSVTQDVDGIVDKVKSFIEDYNKMLSSLYELYSEKPESGYSPLTQSQKDAMKEEQVTKWEEKAKKGILYHDRTIGNVISKLREALSSKVEGLNDKYDSIFSIGISTTGLQGQLTLDETKLRRALDENPDSVYNVFAKLDSNYTDSSGKKVERTSHNGVAQRLGDIFSNSLKTIRSRSGTSSDTNDDSEINNILRRMKTQMSDFKKKMNAYEDMLYKKYDRMESMLAKLGAQMNYIMGGQQ